MPNRRKVDDARSCWRRVHSAAVGQVWAQIDLLLARPDVRRSSGLGFELICVGKR